MLYVQMQELYGAEQQGAVKGLRALTELLGEGGGARQQNLPWCCELDKCASCWL